MHPVAKPETSHPWKRLFWGTVALCALVAITYLLLRNWTSHTPRAKVAEAVLGLSEYRSTLVAFFLEHKRLPLNAAEAAMPLEPRGRYTREIRYDGAKGELKAVLRDIPGIESGVLTLRVDTSTGALTWRCFGEGIRPTD